MRACWRRTPPAATTSTCPRTSRCGSTATSCSRPSASPTRPTATLNAAKSNAILVTHALTGDQYAASQHPVTDKPGWWETMVGPGKPIDTDRFFVICPNVLGGCMGSTGPGQHQPRDRQALGPRFSRHHHRRHGGRPGAADRPSRHRPAVLRDRRLDGRHAGAGVGRAPRRPRFTAVPIATAAWHSSQNIAFHEVGRQAVMADPDWCAGPLPRARHGAAQRPRRGAHGRAHHLPVGGGAAAQVRPQPAGPGGQDLQLQRRLPGRELSAPPGLDLRRPLRRQQLSLHHAGDRLLRPRGRARRRAGQRLQGHQDALLRGLLHQRLALPDAREPRDRAGAERGGGQRQLRRDRVRQGPRRLPARGAGAVRHRPRLPQRGGREARAEARAGERADAGARQPSASTASTTC